MSHIRIARSVSRLTARQVQPSMRLSILSKAPSFLAAARSLSPKTLQRPSLTSAMSTGHSRFYTTQAYTAADLSPGDYHKASDMALESILDVLETIGDEHDIDGYDVEYSQGVLTLKLGSGGTYVLNKQPPNRQIWLSSPKSGPKRYDYDETHNKWFYARDNHTIDEVLNEELSEILGMDVKVLD